jgi:hypothetical protein
MKKSDSLLLLIVAGAAFAAYVFSKKSGATTSSTSNKGTYIYGTLTSAPDLAKLESLYAEGYTGIAQSPTLGYSSLVNPNPAQSEQAYLQELAAQI